MKFIRGITVRELSMTPKVGVLTPDIVLVCVVLIFWLNDYCHQKNIVRKSA